MLELTYAAGLDEGVVIASGSSFVVVRGRVDSDHALSIWTVLVEGRTLPEVLDAVTRGRLGELPDFVVAVPHAATGGLRLVQRPGLEVVTIDPAGARETHSALDSALWSERSVPADSVVEIDLTGAAGAAGTLPLASGAAPTTFVRWTPALSSAPGDQPARRPAEPVDAPEPVPEPEPVHEPEPVDVPPGNLPGSVEIVDDVVVADTGVDEVDAVEVLVEESTDDLPESVADGFTVSGLYTITDPQLVAESSVGDGAAPDEDAPAVAAVEADPYDSLFGATTHRSVESAAVRPGSEPSQVDEPAVPVLDVPTPPDPVRESVPAPAVEEPDLMIDSVPVAVPPPAAADVPAPPGDHDGYTVSAASLRELRRGAADAGVPGAATTAAPVVHAISCSAGHPNPPQSATCRVCGNPLAFQEPITVPRPPLGVLVFAGGREVTLDRFVLIGRSPVVERVAPGDLPHLVKLDSPNKDLSRNHMEIRLEGWHVLVVDLQSTNGTVVQLPGRPPERVHPLEPYAIVPGTVITLGDEQSFVYEVRG